MIYKLYTDGSCKANGKENAYGAWYALLIDENGNHLAECGQAFINATNQRAELLALINGCQMVESELDEFFECEVISDSAYCIRCKNEHWYTKWLSNGWINSKKQPVANKELWEQLIPYFEDCRFSFIKTKGHANDIYNNYVDEHAQYLAAARGNKNE